MAGRAPIGEVLDQSQVPRPGDLIAAKYLVEAVVGSGGMGVVLSARHVQLDQEVAIKVLSKPDDPQIAAESTARFFREGRAAAMLRSDHVVKVHDVGVLANGLPYIVMELLKGADLSTLLNRYRRFPIRHAVEALIQAGDAISEAHRRGIVHRDLKPSNLFVTERSDGAPLIKVLDFGVSKSRKDAELEGDLTSSRSVLGSPFYMSPEQIRDSKHVDYHTDIWSLGAILHELLSGHPPFEADTLPAACAAIAADSPRPLGLVRDDVPAELEAIAMRCLEKNPAMRYASVDELVAALRPFSALTCGEAPPRFDVGALPTVVPPASPADSDGAQNDPSYGPTLASVAPEPPLAGVTSHTRTRASQDSLSGRDAIPCSPTDTLGAGVGPIAEEHPKRRPARLGAFVVLGFVLVGAGWRVAVRTHDAPNPRPAPSSRRIAPAASATFSLLIESVPSGAEVYEQNERLGTTPLALPIRVEDVRIESRVFELRREGFESNVFTQGVAQGNVQHRVTLRRVPQPATDRLAAPANSAAAAPRRSRPRRTAAPEPPPEPSPPPAPGIRLSR